MPNHNDEAQVEEMIESKGLRAPRIKPEDVDAEIVGEDYHIFPGTTVTICLLKLKNGFSVTGESAAASPHNFDEEIGRTIARGKARDKIWAFLGFRLRDQLTAEGE
jgi:hypothetical protein